MQGTEYLQAKFQIGSCKGRMDYEENERVFHHSDIPQQSKDARKAVQQSVRSKALSNNPDWSISTHTGAGVSATQPAPWDKTKFEDRYYAAQETESRLQAEAQYKANQIKRAEDQRYINPEWNQSTIFQRRSAPARDEYLSNSRAEDGSRSLRFGNESFVPPEPYSAPDGTMNTVYGETQLGTGLPHVMAFDPTASAKQSRPGSKQRLPINYTSLVERQNKEALRLRAHKKAKREQEANAIRPAPARPFQYPDMPNFRGTARPDAAKIAAQINETYTKDSLTRYLETMDLSATVKVMGASQTLEAPVAVSE